VRTKLGLLSPIASQEDALAMIRAVAYGFYFLAALQAVGGFFLDASMIADGVLIGVLALFLHTLKSRIAAVLLLLFSLGVALSTVLNVLGLTRVGGGNLILATLALVASIRAIEATFKFHRSEPEGRLRVTSVGYSAPPASPERRRIELTRPSAPSVPTKGVTGVRPLVTQPDLARLLRFAASQCAFDASGLRARTIDGKSCVLPWSQLAEVRGRILPADRPWDSALIVDFVPVSTEGQPAAPIRLLPLTGMTFRALPGTPAGTRRENIRRLVQFALSHSTAATIEPESARFFREGGECPRFASISQFSDYDARYG
jgi:hypothetical protein